MSAVFAQGVTSLEDLVHVEYPGSRVDEVLVDLPSQRVLLEVLPSRKLGESAHAVGIGAVRRDDSGRILAGRGDVDRQQGDEEGELRTSWLNPYAWRYSEEGGPLRLGAAFTCFGLEDGQIDEDARALAGRAFNPG